MRIIMMMRSLMHAADVTLLLAELIRVVLDLGKLLQDLGRVHVTADVDGGSEAVQEPVLQKR
jgi:hypothetical protein